MTIFSGKGSGPDGPLLLLLSLLLAPIATNASPEPRINSLVYQAGSAGEEFSATLQTVCRGALLLVTMSADAAREAGIFHHLITLPTYHTAALSTDNLAKEYFGDNGMLGYVAGVQRKEIREGIACVKHQNMSGSDMGDDHKEYFAGDAALKAAGEDNTMNQF